MRNIHLPGIALAAACAACSSPTQKNDEVRLPNIIYILADDLGYGDLGCYGQEKILTPHLDKLAAGGMMFTSHYSGSTVCAPSRSSLLTGLHTGKTGIRGNKELQPEGQEALPAEYTTIAQVLKEGGYSTGAFGKWGLGMPGTTGFPGEKGFDQFFGYLCQRQAHRYYPSYLWDNDQKVYLEGNDLVNTVTYAPDVIHERSLQFIRDNKEKPFFLYVPTLFPHAELLAPEDSFLALYQGKFPEVPWGVNNTSGNVYDGNDYGAADFDIQGYASIKNPRATYAAMVTRMDHQVGEIIRLLEDLGIAGNTLVIFASDNGPHTEAGNDPGFFNSTAGFRGTKRDLHEGGIRVPMIASWPGKIAPGSKSDHVSAFWDVFPTLAEVAGIATHVPVDGISFLPTLLGLDYQEQHEYLYWEFHEMGGRQALRQGDWKLVKYDVLDPSLTRTELFNLETDPFESKNLAGQYPERVAELEQLMKQARVPSALFPFVERLE